MAISIPGLLLATATEGAAPPALGLDGGFGWDLLRSALVLAAICALAYLLIRFGLRPYLGRTRAAQNARLPLEVLARLPLEPRRSVYAVRAGNRVLLLGVTDKAISLLAELPDAALGANGAQPGGDSP